MNGELAQAIALVAWGNQALGSSSPPATNLASENSTFRYVERLVFTTIQRGVATEVATTPEAWFAWLATRGVRRLRLVIRAPSRGAFPARVMAAFAGSDQWNIVEASAIDRPGSWQSQWTVGERESPTPWHVRYNSPSGGRPRPHSNPTVDEARAALAAALADVSEVARAGELSIWLEWFRASMEQLKSDSPRARFHDDALPPTGYELRARQLFAAAVGAWVFGGMGSWNDAWLPDEQLRRRYQVASGQLYTAVLNSFPAVLESARRS